MSQRSDGRATPTRESARPPGDRVRWGILGTGLIAGWFATDLPASRTGRLEAVASRDIESARRFSSTHGGRPHGSYEALLDDADVDAVYLALPNHLHTEWAIRAAQQGKHVLVEKPMALTEADAIAAFKAAQANGVTMLEGVMFRSHPQIALVHQLVNEGRIGRIGLIESSFGGRIGTGPNIRGIREFGGGALMDRGVYGVSFSRMVAGAVSGASFAEPISTTATGHLGPASGVDEWSSITLRFAHDILAVVTVATQIPMAPVARIWGTEGDIRLSNPWQAGFHDADGSVSLTVGDRDPEITLLESPPIYAAEADHFADAMEGKALPPLMATREDTLGNMRVLDVARSHLGLSFGPAGRDR